MQEQNHKELFRIRLKQLREEMGVTQVNAAKAVNVSTPSYAAYESGKSAPSMETLIGLSIFFNVPLDWLCGLREEKRPECEIETYGDMIRALSDIASLIPVMLTQENGHETICLDEEIMQLFLSEWKDILNLYYEGTIKKDLYDLWVKKQIKKHDFKTNDTKAKEMLKAYNVIYDSSFPFVTKDHPLSEDKTPPEDK